MSRTTRVEGNSWNSTEGTWDWTRSSDGEVFSYVNPPIPAGSFFLSDSHGIPYVDSDFLLEKFTAINPRLNGTHQSFGWHTMNGVLPEAFIFGLPQSYARTAELVAPDNLRSAALANANPNRPEVDLPVSIGELAELPSLLRGIGRSVFNRNISASGSGLDSSIPTPGTNSIGDRIASSNLIYEFGIKPLVSDFNTLLNFAEASNRRLEYLRKLSDGWTTIKRTLGSNQRTRIHTYKTPWQFTSSGQVHLKVTAKVSMREWYSLRARLTSQLSYHELSSQVPSIIRGTSTAELAQLWELLPWSWLIDWYSNIGDLLQSSRGKLRWEHKDLNLMRSLSIKLSSPSQSGTYPGGGSYTISPGLCKYKRKSRKISFYPTLELGVPVLSGRQVRILSSLAFLRSAKLR